MNPNCQNLPDFRREPCRQFVFTHRPDLRHTLGVAPTSPGNSPEAPIMRIDINADLGEGCGWDDALLERVTSASISCGAHAGTPAEIIRTLRRATARGVVIGAHPGYRDRDGFGRREHDLPDAEIARQVVVQLDELAGWSAQVGATIRFVKPHGALYNQAQRDARIAAAVVAGVRGWDLPLLGQPGSEVERAAELAGVRFVAEGFVDRRYLADGRLMPRTEPGAVLSDQGEIRAQVLALAGRGIETLCVHGDNAHSVVLADLARLTLQEAGFAVRGFI